MWKMTYLSNLISKRESSHLEALINHGIEAIFILFIETLNAQFALNMLLGIWQKPAKILCGGIQLKYRAQRFPKVEVKEKISSDSKITENVRKQKTMQMSQQKINHQNHFQNI